VGNNDPETITVVATGVFPRIRVGLTRVEDDGTVFAFRFCLMRRLTTFLLCLGLCFVM